MFKIILFLVFFEGLNFSLFLNQALETDRGSASAARLSHYNNVAFAYAIAGRRRYFIILFPFRSECAINAAYDHGNQVLFIDSQILSSDCYFSAWVALFGRYTSYQRFWHIFIFKFFFKIEICLKLN